MSCAAPSLSPPSHTLGVKVGPSLLHVQQRHSNTWAGETDGAQVRQHCAQRRLQSDPLTPGARDQRRPPECAPQLLATEIEAD